MSVKEEEKSSALQRLRDWLSTYPGYSVLERFQVDYTSALPYSGGVYPKGQVELSHSSDILGNWTLYCEYNFKLQFSLPDPTVDETEGDTNAEWLMAFQHWVQEQSAQGLAPTFGNVDLLQEHLKAQSGQLEKASGEAIGTYSVLLTATFKKKYEVN